MSFRRSTTLSKTVRAFVQIGKGSLLLSFAVGILGCDSYLRRNNPPAEDQVVMESHALSCIRGVPGNLTQFLNDQLGKEQVSDTFACLRGTVDHFQKFTRGNEGSSVYAPEELRSFLNEALPRNRQISAAFMSELMKLKTVLLGGSPAGMTKAEITQARVLLSTFESEAQALRGQMRLLLFQAPRDLVTLQQVKTAQRQLEKSVAAVMEVARPEATEYDFQDIENLVTQFHDYLGNQNLLTQLLRWLPITQKVKTLFVGERTLTYSQKDWQQVLGWSARAYGLALEYAYWIRGLDLKSPDDVDRMIDFGDSVFDLVEDSPNIKERGAVSTIAIDEVLDEAIQAKLLNPDIPLPLLQVTYRQGIATLLSEPPQHGKAPFEVLTMTSDQIARLRFEWNAWVLIQKQINASFRREMRLSASLPSRILPQGITRLEAANLQVLAKDVTFSKLLEAHDGVLLASELAARPRLRPGERQALRQASKDWKAAIAGDYPLLWNEENRLAVTRHIENVRLGFEGTTTAGLLHIFSRLILRGYGHGPDTNPWHARLRVEDFVRFEQDFREMGVWLKAIDPRTPNPAERNFQEANFFTFSGDGDAFLSAQELFEEFNILASAGGQIASELQVRAEKRGCGVHFPDTFGHWYLNANCFWQGLDLDFNNSFWSVPGLVAYQMGIQGTGRELEIRQRLTELGWGPQSREGIVEFSDLRTYATILHYVEILRLVYDRDQNLKLSYAEIEAAAPRFHQFLRARNPLGNVLTDTFFMCMVFEQEKPQIDWATMSCVARPKFIGYDDIGLLELLRVLSVLKTEMAKETIQQQAAMGPKLMPLALPPVRESR